MPSQPQRATFFLDSGLLDPETLERRRQSELPTQPRPSFFPPPPAALPRSSLEGPGPVDVAPTTSAAAPLHAHHHHGPHHTAHASHALAEQVATLTRQLGTLAATLEASEAAHARAAELLQARVTVLEGRVKFLEHGRPAAPALTAEATALSLADPAPAAGSQALPVPCRSASPSPYVRTAAPYRSEYEQQLRESYELALPPSARDLRVHARAAQGPDQQKESTGGSGQELVAVTAGVTPSLDAFMRDVTARLAQTQEMMRRI